jgi:hypothetical protein
MTMHRQDDWGDDGELRARLDAYAASRLEPDPAATARARATVMAQARLGRGATRTVDDAPGPGLLGRIFRRPALAATAALLGLAVVAGGTVAAAEPGGPLYGARLWVETLTLPSDTNGRAAAELDRLQARLDDATAAAANGNGDAVTAALDAYRQTLAGASAAAGGDPTREEPLVAELGRHQAVLGALATRVPPTAAAAIQQAVQRTQDKINAIIEAPSRPGRTPNPGQPNGTPNPGQPARTPNPGQPGRTPNPGSAGHSPDPGHPTNPSDPDKTPPAP